MLRSIALLVPLALLLLAGCMEDGSAPEGVPGLPKKEPKAPMLGQAAPAFEAESTAGPVKFPEAYAGRWVVLFSYPADFTPVSTTEFLQFATSAEADAVIAKSGFIDLGIRSQTMTMDGDRATTLLNAKVDAYESRIIRQKLDMMVQHDRLTTTFRFRTGSSRLDERGRIDMARLVDYLEAMPEGAKVRFVGFTDNVGAFDSNLALSIARAKRSAYG